MIESETVSLCEHCYRHISALKFRKDNKMWLGKTCPEHGYHECVIETDADFYESQSYIKKRPSTYWLDITNRCNLDCPHCYQMPDNMSRDPSIDQIINEIAKWPDDGAAISLVGAEPTTRKDLPKLVKEIQNLLGKPRTIIIVTNGINLGKRKYAEQFQSIENLKWSIGLNHPDYNGGLIRKKQQVGIDNCVELGLEIKNFTYTLSGLDQLEYVFDETQKWHAQGICSNARIQLGVDIGRVPENEHEEYFLSDLVKYAKKLVEQKNWSWNVDHTASNRTHYATNINGVLYRLIKWCDVKTIDLEETQSESWAQLIPGKPMSSLLHQVILRDRNINMNLPLLDTVPQKYQNTNVPYEKTIRLTVAV
jgi:molybdenum cofactor biosynthesis enzyme MoaA